VSPEKVPTGLAKDVEIAPALIKPTTSTIMRFTSRFITTPNLSRLLTRSNTYLSRSSRIGTKLNRVCHWKI
jgi:hypothetical protein